MKIGAITTIHSTCLRYQIRDIAWGFQAIGHEVTILQEGSKWCEGMDAIETDDIANFMTDFKPDVIVIMNDTRARHDFKYFGGRWITVMADRIVDLYDMELAKRDNETDTLACMTWDFVKEMEFVGHKNVYYLPLGANTDLFRPIESVAKKNSMAIVTRLNSQMPHMRFQYRAKSARIAIEAVKKAGCDLNIYGDGWELQDEFKPYYRGDVSNGEELVRVYNENSLVVHSNEDAHWHMRPMDAMACGTPVASLDFGYDLDGRLHDYPYPYVHLFRDADGLAQIYKAATAHYMDYQKAMVDWIRKYHSWKQRCELMLSKVKF